MISDYYTRKCVLKKCTINHKCPFAHFGILLYFGRFSNCLLLFMSALLQKKAEELAENKLEQWKQCETFISGNEWALKVMKLAAEERLWGICGRRSFLFLRKRAITGWYVPQLQIEKQTGSFLSLVISAFPLTNYGVLVLLRKNTCIMPHAYLSFFGVGVDG